MSRLLCATIVLAGLTAVASSRPAAPPAPKKEGKVAPAEKAPVSARTTLRALLQPINFPGIEQDRTTTLKDVLDKVRKDYGLAYTFNELAFRHEGLTTPPVWETPIVESSPLPPMKATLGKVLSQVLERVPVYPGGTFMVREDGVEITTYQFQVVEAEIMRSRQAWPVPPSPSPGLITRALLGALAGALGLDLAAPEDAISVPVVSVAVEKQPLEEACRQLRAQTKASIVVDPTLKEKAQAPLTITLLNVPLDSALILLAELADVDFVWLDNIFFITSPDKARRLKSRWPDRRAGGGGLLSRSGSTPSPVQGLALPSPRPFIGPYLDA
jgi:hypothetical protein